jgi:hypothetical protein
MLQEGLQHRLILKNLQKMMHGGNQIQQAKELDSSPDVGMGLGLEESLVFSSGGERGGGIDDDGCIG